MSPHELGLVLASALLHASWNVAIKGSTSPTALLLAIEVASVALFLPVLLLGFTPSDIPLPVWGWLGSTAVVHALYAYWLSRAYVHGDLSLVYPIARTAPAFVPLFAVPLMGESVSLAAGLGIALVVAGMWAVQTDGRLQPRALLSRAAMFAYLTLLMTIAYSLIDKEAMRLLHDAAWSGRAPRALVYMALFCLLSLPLFALLALRSVTAGEVLQVARRSWAIPIGAALVSMGSYGLVLEVLRTAPVSYVVSVRQSSVLFAVVLGVLLLRERPGPVRIVGAATTVGGVALIALYP